jgi:hypothetical protein
MSRTLSIAIELPTGHEYVRATASLTESEVTSADKRVAAGFARGVVLINGAVFSSCHRQFV